MLLTKTTVADSLRDAGIEKIRGFGNNSARVCRRPDRFEVMVDVDVRNKVFSAVLVDEDGPMADADFWFESPNWGAVVEWIKLHSSK
jgi:hypothetical protein